MPDPGVGAIDILRIDTVELTHPLGKIALHSLHHDMVVVTHQAISMTNPVEPLAHVSKNTTPGKPILVAGKDILPPVPPRCDVVQAAGKFES